MIFACGDIYLVIFAARYLLRDICLRRYLLRVICLRRYLLRDIWCAIFAYAIAALCLCVFVFKKNADGICDGFLFSIFNFQFCFLCLCGLVFLCHTAFCRKANYVSLIFIISFQLSIIIFFLAFCGNNFILWFHPPNFVPVSHWKTGTLFLPP